MGEDLKDLPLLKERFNYIDSITIVDNTGKIIVQLRYNPRFTPKENEIENNLYINKNILEVFPSLTPETSTLLQALNKGETIYCENQTVWSFTGKKITVTNLTFPIISRGKIIGAVEVAKDLTHIEDKISKGINEKKASSNIKVIPISDKYIANYTLNDIISINHKIKKLKEIVKKISFSISSVLIYGETGTGKELFAQAIHNESIRKNYPFVAVNCAALPESLLEGILFGTIKGAFTGAENRKGLFEIANGGTIYLDEINSMPINLQAKLLRVLEDKAVLPLGGTSPVKIDVRIIASINKEPKEIIKRGEIREDLLYRLNTINIKIPPLRERPEDIFILAEHFIEKYNKILNKSVTSLNKKVQELFKSYHWPGNVRELEHVIEAAMNIVEGNTIEIEHLPLYLSEDSSSIHQELPSTDIIPLKKALEQYEQNIISSALLKSGGNVSKAAKLLKIPRTTLQYKIEKYKIKI